MGRHNQKDKEKYIDEMMYLEYLFTPYANKVVTDTQTYYKCQCGLCGKKFTSNTKQCICDECEDDNKFYRDKYATLYDKEVIRANEVKHDKFTLFGDLSKRITNAEIGLENKKLENLKRADYVFMRQQECPMFDGKCTKLVCKRCKAGKNIMTGEPDTRSARVCTHHPIAANGKRYIIKSGITYTDYLTSTDDETRANIVAVNEYNGIYADLVGVPTTGSNVSKLRAEWNKLKEELENELS